MRVKERARLILDGLEKEYPLAECTLDYQNAWQLLVGVRLAAQCTDARVNVVTEQLFALYPSPAALVAAGADAIEAVVKPRGLLRQASTAAEFSHCMYRSCEEICPQLSRLRIQQGIRVP